jgi:hypothetical protein
MHFYSASMNFMLKNGATEDTGGYWLSKHAMPGGKWGEGSGDASIIVIPAKAGIHTALESLPSTFLRRPNGFPFSFIPFSGRE